LSLRQPVPNTICTHWNTGCTILEPLYTLIIILKGIRCRIHLIAPNAEAIVLQMFYICSVYDTCFTGRSFIMFILKQGISAGNADNFCLDATNKKSVFVKFKVSLLAESDIYALFRS